MTVNTFPVQLWRATRTSLHVLEGLLTTTVVFPLVSPRRRRALVKGWSGRLLRILRVRAVFTSELRPGAGNVLLVANHVSWLDIFVLNAVHPVRFVAKAELAKWPLAARLIRGAGTVFIERTRRADTHRVNQQVAAVLAGGDVVAVFPEGTTTDGTALLPFKSSLLQPIVDARGHVQPVAIRYVGPDGHQSLAPAYIGEMTFVESFWRICGARRLTVELHASVPLPADAAHRRELARAAESAIRTALAGPAGD